VREEMPRRRKGRGVEAEGSSGPRHTAWEGGFREGRRTRERERERARQKEREGYRAHGPEGWVTGTYGREGIVNRIQSKF
jgi:hypothetical protein